MKTRFPHLLAGLALTLGASLAVPVLAAEATADFSKVPGMDSVQRHWDPGHAGHWHSAPNGVQYHAEGDLYPGSPAQCSHGFLLGQHCADPRPNPPSPPPGPYPPTPPPPPGPYPPPGPGPYPPPYPGPGMSVEELLRAWDQARDYRSADAIIVAGARQLPTVRGILRLAVKAYYDSSREQILASLNRQGLTDFPSAQDMHRFWDAAKNYQGADAVLYAGTAWIQSARQQFQCVTRAYYEQTADRMLDNIRRNYNRLPDPPSVNDLLNGWNAASKYTVADKILLAGVPYMRSMGELVQLANRAYYGETKRAIEAAYSHVGYPPPYGQRLVAASPLDGKAAPAKKGFAVPLEIMKATLIEISMKKEGPMLTKDDIAKGDLAKIGRFTSDLGAKKYKPSPLLGELRGLSIVRLKALGLKGDANARGLQKRLESIR